MNKYIYRLWFPMVDYHGSCFDKFCEECQGQIEEKLKDGFVLPTKVSIDTSIGISIKFGFSMTDFEPCKACQKKLVKFLEDADFMKFGSEKSIQLWRNKKDETV